MPPFDRLRHVPFVAWASLPLMVAAFLRFRGISELEPFVGEGANILTALDPGVRSAFEPLEQGRPLLVWLFLPSGLLPSDALNIARSMSALAGLATLTAIGWTLHSLGGRGAALIGMWTWAVLPVAVWHERLALQDPFVTVFLAGAIAMMTAGSRPEGRAVQAWWFAAAGMLIGTAFLCKISALLTLPWLGLMYWSVEKHFGRRWLEPRLASLAIGALVPVLMLGPELFRLGSGLRRYDALPSLEGDFVFAAIGRFKVWLGWYAGYGGWALLLLLVTALVVGIGRRTRLGLWCAAGWGISLLVSSFTLNNVYGRYTLPDHLVLIFSLALTIGPPAAGRWCRISSAAAILAVIWWTGISLQIGTDPARAAVPQADRVQYVTGPWSGRGIRKVHHYLADYADRNEALCAVLVHRYLRSGCYGLLLAQLGDPRVAVVPFTVYEPGELSVALSLLKRRLRANQEMACFILYEGSLYPAPPWLDQSGAPTRLVLSVDRGAGETFSVYKVTQ